MFNFNYQIMCFIITVMLFSFLYKHILLTLISLEFMMINLMMNLYSILIYMNLSFYFNTIFLTISICEGVMGLSIMVYMIRFSGNDYINSMNLIKW